MLTHSLCGEFFTTSDGWLYQQVGFPDPVGVRIGHMDTVDADEAPERYRPAIVELLDRWNDARRDAGHAGDLAHDYRAALAS